MRTHSHYQVCRTSCCKPFIQNAMAWQSYASVNKQHIRSPVSAARCSSARGSCRLVPIYRFCTRHMRHPRPWQGCWADSCWSWREGSSRWHVCRLVPAWLSCSLCDSQTQSWVHFQQRFDSGDVVRACIGLQKCRPLLVVCLGLQKQAIIRQQVCRIMLLSAWARATHISAARNDMV